MCKKSIKNYRGFFPPQIICTRRNKIKVEKRKKMKRGWKKAKTERVN